MYLFIYTHSYIYIYIPSKQKIKKPWWFQLRLFFSTKDEATKVLALIGDESEESMKRHLGCNGEICWSWSPWLESVVSRC